MDSNAHQYTYAPKCLNAFKKAVEITEVRWKSRSIASQLGEPMTDAEDVILPPGDVVVNITLDSNHRSWLDNENSH